METDIAESIGKYIDLRDKLDRICRKYQEFENSTKAELNVIEMSILNFQDNLKLTSVSSSRGTAFRVKKEYYKMGDWNKFIAYIVKTKNYQMLEKRVAKIATKEVIDVEELDPVNIGVDYSSEWKIQIRRK